MGKRSKARRKQKWRERNMVIDIESGKKIGGEDEAGKWLSDAMHKPQNKQMGLTGYELKGNVYVPKDGASNGSPSTTYTYKKCTHNGEIPIKIGGYDVWLTGSYMVTQEAMKQCNLFITLNGDEPRCLEFGQIIQYQYASLPDRGGVPKNWKEFVETTAKNIRNGFRVMFWCTGSHGRTGVLGASLIAVMEPETEDPIAAIRERHCTSAVESFEQAKAVFALKDQELPKEYVEEFTKKVTSFAGYSNGYSGKSNYTPKPGPDGKSISGMYYHHLSCKCGKCSLSIQYTPNPCECKNPDGCLWDGVIRPTEGPFPHCHSCKCGKCCNESFHFITYCICDNAGCDGKEGGKYDKSFKTPNKTLPPISVPYAVVDNTTGAHEWYCICGLCIAAEAMDQECSKGQSTKGICQCKQCTIDWKKNELTHVNQLNHKYGSTGHSKTCACGQCLHELEERQRLQQEVAELDEEKSSYGNDEMIYCEYCDGDSTVPCEHIATAVLSNGSTHDEFCGCQECWFKLDEETNPVNTSGVDSHSKVGNNYIH